MPSLIHMECVQRACIQDSQRWPTISVHFPLYAFVKRVFRHWVWYASFFSKKGTPERKAKEWVRENLNQNQIALYRRSLTRAIAQNINWIGLKFWRFFKKSQTRIMIGFLSAFVFSESAVIPMINYAHWHGVNDRDLMGVRVFVCVFMCVWLVNQVVQM